METRSGIGIVGGSGQLGGAIARALLHKGLVTPDRLFISNRSGRVSGFEEWPGITFTTRNQDLPAACRTLVLCVPPNGFSEVKMKAGGCLVISVMAGVTLDRISDVTGAAEVVRAMSSPAAEIGLAYSPWFAGPSVSREDLEFVQSLFEACGETDELEEEDQINLFTAMTGPVPGFVAFYASCMVKYAVRRGVKPAIADRAVRQLFKASGSVMAGTAASPADHVREMIDYAGTTAAGLIAMRDSTLCSTIEQGLDAACRRARTITTEQ